MVIKTLNKKYYKRFDIPDLKRLNLELDESKLKVNFQNNTLIISVKYKLYFNIFELNSCYKVYKTI